jgi:hypothetical protein
MNGRSRRVTGFVIVALVASLTSLFYRRETPDGERRRRACVRAGVRALVRIRYCNIHVKLILVGGRHNELAVCKRAVIPCGTMARYEPTADTGEQVIDSAAMGSCPATQHPGSCQVEPVCRVYTCAVPFCWCARAHFRFRNFVARRAAAIRLLSSRRCRCMRRGRHIAPGLQP